jgi:hypothetical protein
MYRRAQVDIPFPDADNPLGLLPDARCRHPPPLATFSPTYTSTANLGTLSSSYSQLVGMVVCNVKVCANFYGSA